MTCNPFPDRGSITRSSQDCNPSHGHFPAANSVHRAAARKAALVSVSTSPPLFQAALTLLLLVLFTLNAGSAHTNEVRSLLIVIGAAGEAEFGESFSESAALWKHTGNSGGFRVSTIGEDPIGSTDDRTRLLEALKSEVAVTNGELWIVFIGHGTFDGQTAKFNLRGPDVSAAELAAALKTGTRPIAVLQCASASAPFMGAIAGPGRVVITATKSGYELNATRFGNFLARSIGNPSADLDKDGQTSLLEAYLMASRLVEQFYKEEGRLATEHALLDDNGDGLGTPAEWFRGVRAIKKAADGKSVDGIRAHQLNVVRSKAEQELSPETRARRDQLEQKLSALRDKKAQMNADEYYRQLEVILVEIAGLYEQQDTPKAQPASAGAR